MTYTLDTFVKDAQAALRNNEGPAGREQVRVLLERLLANPSFGSLVTSSGASFTWSGNSREHRLTPFDNDPVVDGSAEVIYVRDDDTGEVWGATPGAVARRPGDAWLVRHRGPADAAPLAAAEWLIQP